MSSRGRRRKKKATEDKVIQQKELTYDDQKKIVADLDSQMESLNKQIKADEKETGSSVRYPQREALIIRVDRANELLKELKKKK